MRVRILLQVAADDADFAAAEEVATFEKRTAGIEDLGPSLAEGKTLLAAAQRRVVEVQTAAWLGRHRHCVSCGRRRRAKDSYPVVFRTLFGHVDLASPRFQRCSCNAAGTATVSPLRGLIVDHVATALLPHGVGARPAEARQRLHDHRHRARLKAGGRIGTGPADRGAMMGDDIARFCHGGSRTDRLASAWRSASPRRD